MSGKAGMTIRRGSLVWWLIFWVETDEKRRDTRQVSLCVAFWMAVRNTFLAAPLVVLFAPIVFIGTGFEWLAAKIRHRRRTSYTSSSLVADSVRAWKRKVCPIIEIDAPLSGSSSPQREPRQADLA